MSYPVLRVVTREDDFNLDMWQYADSVYPLRHLIGLDAWWGRYGRGDPKFIVIHFRKLVVSTGYRPGLCYGRPVAVTVSPWDLINHQNVVEEILPLGVVL